MDIVVPPDMDELDWTQGVDDVLATLFAFQGNGTMQADFSWPAVQGSGLDEALLKMPQTTLFPQSGWTVTTQGAGMLPADLNVTTADPHSVLSVSASETNSGGLDMSMTAQGPSGSISSVVGDSSAPWRARPPSSSGPTRSGSSNAASSGVFTGSSIPSQGEVPSWHTVLANSGIDHWPAWQQTFQKDTRQASAPAQATRKKPGRKPDPNVIGKPAYKDKKRENTLKIRELEAQLQLTLNLVKNLEGENEALKRKEKLLQLSVSTSEQNMNRFVDPQLVPTLQKLLVGFRSTYNRANAERILSKVSHIENPKEMSIEVFRTTWQALVLEMSEVLMALETAATPQVAAEAAARAERMTSQVLDYTMAICVHDLNLIIHAQSINMVTGQELPGEDLSIWIGIAGQLGLTEEQTKDLVGAFDMFSRAIHRNNLERRTIMQELDQRVAKPLDLTQGAMCAEADAIADLSEQLHANLKKCNVLCTMLSFLTLRLMTPVQTLKMCMHSSPLFPNLKCLVFGVAVTAAGNATGLDASPELVNALLAGFNSGNPQMPAQVPV